MHHHSDIIEQQIPAHVVDSYPFFVQFLRGYYEWLDVEGNPYERIKNHLNHLNFEKSLDDYTKFMMQEYLTKIPKNVLGDKKLFIEWSKKFNLIRGSHESYKFLFNMLFGEQTTEIYLPKDNILRCSDGVWIENQSIIITTNSGSPEKLLFKRIKQKRPSVVPGEFVYAEATIDGYLERYFSGFKVLELILVDIIGEFEEGYKIYDGSGNEEWPIPTISNFTIENSGSNYFVSEKIIFNNWIKKYEQSYIVTEEGKLDTRITTLLSKNQIYAELDDTPLNISEYNYDGRFLISDLFELGKKVYFKLDNPYPGGMFIKETGSSGEVLEIGITTSPIAIQGSKIDITTIDPHGEGLLAKANVGLIRKLPGFYVGQRGQLSTNMVLQDGDYYQEYSYEIRTQQNIVKYSQIVKEVLHPAGFKMFGRIRILDIIKALIGAHENHVIIANVIKLFNFTLYSLGANYLWFAKSGKFMSPRMYNGNEWDEAYLTGDVGYDLSDKSNERTYDLDGQKVIVDKRGWMTKKALSDGDILQPQDYFEHNLFKYLYMESSYVNTQNMDITSFKNKYINVYTCDDYWDDYA